MNHGLWEGAEALINVRAIAYAMEKDEVYKVKLTKVKLTRL